MELSEPLALVPPLDILNCYILFLVCLQSYFSMFITSLSGDKIVHVHIYATTLMIIFFWITSNIKISKFLTIQKHDIRHVSISGFAVVLKLDNFDGSNFKL